MRGATDRTIPEWGRSQDRQHTPPPATSIVEGQVEIEGAGCFPIVP